MTTLVPIDVTDRMIRDDALGVLSKAATLGGEVAALLCGPTAAALAVQAAEYGASHIFVAEDPEFAKPLSAPRVALVAELCTRGGFDLILASTTTVAGDMMASLAARLEAGILWGLTDLQRRGDALVGLRLAQNDSVIVEAVWTTKRRIGLFRPYALPPVRRPATAARVESISPVATQTQVRLLECSGISESNGPSLSNAEIIVAGGRGLGVRENLELVRSLAALLGGVAGVSLPLVEAGWAPRSMQIGQTGTVVRPRLYIACGISGQIQHRVGMERAGTIVAINTDPTAPIMNFCDLAVVADVGTIVPEIIRILQQRGAAKDKLETRPGPIRQVDAISLGRVQSEPSPNLAASRAQITRSET